MNTFNVPIKVWCLLIDHNHEPTFGEPFPVSMYSEDTTHDLKMKISKGQGRGTQSSPEWPFVQFATNKIKIWKCKVLKLSAKDPFGLTTNRLHNFKFSDDEDSDVQHLGVAQRMRELGIEDNELLLAMVPLFGTRYLFPCSVFLLSFLGGILGSVTDYGPSPSCD